MCGIAGMVGLSYDDATVSAMLDTMQRRGPDANGQYRTAECCLLHSRLAIIDLEKGRQPMRFVWNNEETL